MIKGIGKVYLGTKEIVKAYLGNNVVYNSAPALDPDAEAFLLAAGITDATITSAINNLVLSLKADSIWAKMTALYPFVGGTASTHKFNLKDPRDLDAAFRLTFVGSPTHSSNGVQGNGTSQYAIPHINPQTVFDQNDLSGFYYVRSAASVNDYAFGVESNTSRFSIFQSTTAIFFAANNVTQDSTALNQAGFGGVSRVASGSYIGAKNASITTFTRNSDAEINDQLFLMARNRPGFGSFFSPRQFSAFYFGTGLTTTEVANLRDINLAFQTALSRNV
jgi:hypothetical protein